MQFPIGALSDRFDRERVILVITLVAGAAALAVAVIGTMPFALLLALTFVMGGLSSPLYPLALAEVNDFLETDELVPAAGAILLAYSLGASAGPLAASALMAVVGPAGLYGFIAVVLFAFGIYAAHRVRQGLAKPADEQTEFQPAMSHATPLAAGLDPRGPEDPAYDLSWDEEEAGDGGKGWS
jgi:MFS family permease